MKETDFHITHKFPRLEPLGLSFWDSMMDLTTEICLPFKSASFCNILALIVDFISLLRSKSHMEMQQNTREEENSSKHVFVVLLFWILIFLWHGPKHATLLKITLNFWSSYLPLPKSWDYWPCLFVSLSHSVDQASLKISAILLPQSLKSWDYRHKPLALLFGKGNLKPSPSLKSPRWPETFELNAVGGEVTERGIVTGNPPQPLSAPGWKSVSPPV